MRARDDETFRPGCQRVVCDARRQLVEIGCDDRVHRPSQHHGWRAREDDGNFVLNGKKSMVLNAESADKIIVVARTNGSQVDKEGIVCIGNNFLFDVLCKIPEQFQ